MLTFAFNTEERKSFFRRRRKREIAAISVGILAYFCYVQFICEPQSPIVKTGFGKIKGQVAKSRSGKEFIEFLGIPYAAPPTGNLRFEPPQPPESWEGIKYANSFGSQCLQIDVITGFMLGAEDCLYLNVYTPKTLKVGDRNLYPVMVWFYGGGFISGASDIYRPNYFMDEDVVLVTLNYRLASLGFLNTGDGVVRGNQGLKDQVMALRWVQQNIRNFSGNPDLVTIFGESAGGGAAHFHMLSPMSRGLFKKAISQSGSVLNSFLYNHNPKEQSKAFGKKLNCPTESSEQLVACLKELDARDIVAEHREMLVPPRPPHGFFVPSVEAVIDSNTFLPASPIEMLERGDFAKVPWMTGVDSGEGLAFALEVVKNETLVKWANNDWNDFIPRILLYNATEHPEAAKKIHDVYLPNSSYIHPIESYENFVEIHSTRFFFLSAHITAAIHSRYAPVYLYYFTYPSEFGFLKLQKSLRGQYVPVVELVGEIIWFWAQKAMGLEIIRGGASHGEELLLQFVVPGIPSVSVGSPDYEMSRALVKTWVGFAVDHTNLKFQNRQWTPTPPETIGLRYMDLNSNTPGMIDEPFTKHIQFWKSLSMF